MSNLIYHEIGEIFEINNKKLYFAESKINDEIKNCISCALDNDTKLCFKMKCSSSERPDRKNTILKEIKR